MAKRTTSTSSNERCEFCNKKITTTTGKTLSLCEDCENAEIFLRDIVKNYLSETPEPEFVNALKEFCWIYCAYHILGGFYNTLVQIMYYFYTNSKETEITKTQIDELNFTSIEINDIVKVAKKAKIIEEIKSGKESDPEKFKSGLLTERIRTQVFGDPSIIIGSATSKAIVQQAFGALSLIITLAFVDSWREKKKEDSLALITSKEGEERASLKKKVLGDIFPRKSIALFFFLGKIISTNLEKPIPREFSLDQLYTACNEIKVDKITQSHILFQFLGFMPQNPGQTNFIEHYDRTERKLRFTPEMENLMIRLRERNRLRIRTR